jgi:hypothetical protein
MQNFKITISRSKNKIHQPRGPVKTNLVWRRGAGLDGRRPFIRGSVYETHGAPRQQVSSLQSQRTFSGGSSVTTDRPLRHSGDCFRVRRPLRARRWREGKILASVVLRTTLPNLIWVMALDTENSESPHKHWRLCVCALRPIIGACASRLVGRNWRVLPLQRAPELP